MKQTEPTTVGFTHVVNWLIASHTESLRSFNNFPFNPRLSAVQTSAQARPSSTQSSSLVIDSCIRYISLQPINTCDAERKGIHFDHREDYAEGAKDGLGWSDTAEFLRKIRRLNGRI
jgi:hypothetical protein